MNKPFIQCVSFLFITGYQFGDWLFCFIYEYSRGGQTVVHFQIFGDPLAFDKNQHFAVFLCCTVRNWNYYFIEKKLLFSRGYF